MIPEFTQKLILWNTTANRRDMPWKGEKDPYKIWLSEIILQQTRVGQGLNYYQKFVSEFPSIQHLALAADEKVFKLWEGLGYYSRCKNLLDTARFIDRQCGGVFPRTYSEIRNLKGIGPYTAAAISSFAFNDPYAVVDGNVQRVLSRYFGIRTPVDSTPGKHFYQQLAQELLDKKQPGVYNQAIMDFGAVICRPQNPLCEECIQREDCVAYQHDFVHELPVKEKVTGRKTRWLYYFLIEVNDKVYVRKRIEKDIWQNLHEFVLLESPNPIVNFLNEHSFLKRVFGDELYYVRHISRLYKQQLTHQDIRGQFIVLKTNKELPALDLFYLIHKERLSHYAFPKFINQFLSEHAV